MTYGSGICASDRSSHQCIHVTNMCARIADIDSTRFHVNEIANSNAAPAFICGSSSSTALRRALEGKQTAIAGLLKSALPGTLVDQSLPQSPGDTHDRETGSQQPHRLRLGYGCSGNVESGRVNVRIARAVP
jgi:hypothetical protein